MELATNRAKLLGVVDFGSKLKFGQIKTTASENLIGDSDSPILRAEIQSRIKIKATQHGLQVFQASDDVLEPIGSGLGKVKFRFELSGSWDAVLIFMQDIEAEKAWLLYESIVIRSSEQEGIPSPSEPVVQVSLVVSGLVFVDGNASAP
jgi:hypothetical protein